MVYLSSLVPCSVISLLGPGSLQRKPEGTGGRVHSDRSQYEAARTPLTAGSPSGTGAEVSLGLAGCWEGEVLRGSTSGHSVNRGCDCCNF